MSRYFFRLDDIAPNMNWDNFNFLVSVFKKHDIKPLLAVIPDNKDPELLKYPANPNFWDTIKELSQNGWIIAQHGFEHSYKTENGGVLKINKRSEFAGLDFKTQKSTIADGACIIKDRLSSISEIFVAPGHSFDKNTIEALKMGGFNYISDGIALYPFKKWGLVWLPQILWRPRKVLLGIITIILHPNTMTDRDFDNLKAFVEKNRNKIGDFSELMNWYDRSNSLMKFLAFLANKTFKIFWCLAFKLKYGLSR